MQRSEWFLVLFLVVIGLTSWWFSGQIEKQAALPQVVEKTHVPTFYSRNMQLVTMNKQGQPEKKLIAERMIKFLDDETTEFKNPQYIAYDGKVPPTIIKASKGWLSKEGDEIKLSGTVYIDREAAENFRPFHLITEQLSIFPEKNYAETDQPIKISSQKDWLNATGMQVWFTNPNKIKLLSRVRGHYENIN